MDNAGTKSNTEGSMEDLRAQVEQIEQRRDPLEGYL